MKKLIRRDWRYFAGIALVFIVSTILGYYLQQHAPHLIKRTFTAYFDQLQKIANVMHGQPVWVEIGIIYANNLTAALLMIALGLFLPLIPLGILIINGMMIGVFQRITQVEKGMNAGQFYLGLLPHGVFELTAVFIAVTLGIRLGMIPYRMIWQRHMSGQPQPLLQTYFSEIRYYLVLIATMLLVAAVIEITISPLFLK